MPQKQLSLSQDVPTTVVIPKVGLRLGNPESTTYAPPKKKVAVPVSELEDLISRDLIERPAQEFESIEDGDQHELPEYSTQDKVDAIIDAIEELPEDAFGSGGKPGVKALENILGENINAAERDEAWEKYQQLTEEN